MNSSVLHGVWLCVYGAGLFASCAIIVLELSADFTLAILLSAGQKDLALFFVSDCTENAIFLSNYVTPYMSTRQYSIIVHNVIICMQPAIHTITSLINSISLIYQGKKSVIIVYWTDLAAIKELHYVQNTLRCFLVRAMLWKVLNNSMCEVFSFGNKGPM